MKIFLNILVSDIKRTIFSFRFLVAVVGFIVVTFVTMFQEISYLQVGVTSVLYIDHIIRYLDFHILYLIFAGIPGTLLFCSDWDNRFFRFAVVRCSKKKYAASKVLACFISAVFVVILSEALTLFLFNLRFPVYDPHVGGLGVFSSLDSANGIVIYFAIKILCEAFCAGFLSVFALWFSTKIVNAFVAISTPLLALISTLSFAFKLPSIFNISSLSKGYVTILENPNLSFWYTILLFGIATMIFGLLFTNSCTRRIQNG